VSGFISVHHCTDRAVASYTVLVISYCIETHQEQARTSHASKKMLQPSQGALGELVIKARQH